MSTVSGRNDTLRPSDLTGPARHRSVAMALSSLAQQASPLHHGELHGERAHAEALHHDGHEGGDCAAYCLCDLPLAPSVRPSPSSARRSRCRRVAVRQAQLGSLALLKLVSCPQDRVIEKDSMLALRRRSPRPEVIVIVKACTQSLNLCATQEAPGVTEPVPLVIHDMFADLCYDIALQYGLAAACDVSGVSDTVPHVIHDVYADLCHEVALQYGLAAACDVPLAVAREDEGSRFAEDDDDDEMNDETDQSEHSQGTDDNHGLEGTSLDVVYDLLRGLSDGGSRAVLLDEVLAACRLPPEVTYEALLQWEVLQVVRQQQGSWWLLKDLEADWWPHDDDG